MKVGDFFLILVQHIFFRMENNVYLCKQKDDSISNIGLSLYSIKKFLIYFRWPVKVSGIFFVHTKNSGCRFLLNQKQCLPLQQKLFIKLFNLTD